MTPTDDDRLRERAAIIEIAERVERARVCAQRSTAGHPIGHGPLADTAAEPIEFALLISHLEQEHLVTDDADDFGCIRGLLFAVGVTAAAVGAALLLAIFIWPPSQKGAQHMSAVPIPIAATDPLSLAVLDLVEAKRAEEEAKRRRVQVEDRILAMHPAKEEGSETFEAGGYKVSLVGKLAYRCDDPRALAEACAAAQWAPSMIPVKTEVKLDETGCKWLRHNEPEAWRLVAQYVEVKPAKTAVSLKV